MRKDSEGSGAREKGYNFQKTTTVPYLESGGGHGQHWHRRHRFYGRNPF